MRFTRVRVVAALALLVLGLLAARAQAQAPAQSPDCTVDCGLHRRACMREGRTALNGCSMLCRDQSDGAPACMRSCLSTFVDAKDTCRGALVTCLGACGPQTAPAQPSGCRSGCGATLNGCVRDVQVGGRACTRGCADDPDRQACVAACGLEARGGAARCRTGLQTCLSGCATPPVRPARLGR
jgi:hypothetical protein